MSRLPRHIKKSSSCFESWASNSISSEDVWSGNESQEDNFISRGGSSTSFSFTFSFGAAVGRAVPSSSPPVKPPRPSPYWSTATAASYFGSADAPETILRIARHATPHDQCVGGFIDRGEVEILEELAMPVPARRICDVYGLPAGGVPRTTVSFPLPIALSTSSVGSSGTGLAT